MGTPVGEFRNPFEDLVDMTDHLLGVTPTEEWSRTGSMDGPRPLSPSSGRPREKKRVGFTGDNTPTARSASLTPGGSGTITPADYQVTESAYHGATTTSGERSHLPSLSAQDTAQIKRALSARLAKPRPAIRNSQAAQQTPPVDSEDDSDGLDEEKAYRRRKAREALQRGKALEEENVRKLSEPVSSSSLASDHDIDVEQHFTESRNSEVPDVPLQHGAPRTESRPTADSPTTAYHSYTHYSGEEQDISDEPLYGPRNDSGGRSGVSTPVAEQHFYEDYQPAPKRYQPSLLASLLGRVATHRHYSSEESAHHVHDRNIPPQLLSTPVTLARRTSKGKLLDTSPEPTPSLGPTPSGSGTSTPSGWRGSWYLGSRQHSFTSLTQLVGSSTSLGTATGAGFSEEVSRRLRKHKEDQKRPGLGERVKSTATLDLVREQIKKSRKKEEHRIKRHVSEILQRQKYILKLCKCFMTFGAPTHRLEEYLNMTARVLEIDAQFLYLVSAMIVSFQDPVTHTTEVKLVKEPTALHLSKMRDTHEIYKEVIYDRISAHEGLKRLHKVTSRPLRVPRWTMVLYYGLASLSVAPFAFEAQWVDLGPCFLLGCIVGILHVYVCPSNRIYADIFELMAAIITSCLARLLGSVKGGNYLCFSAMTESSLALILPGFMVLMASLELQSKNIVSGSVRLVHAIIYSVTLGFGITIGTAIAGGILSSATSETTCANPISQSFHVPFMILFTICLMVINRASLKQSPVMITISLVGFVIYNNASKRLQPSQIASALAALAIGVLANFYSYFSPRVNNWYLRHWDSHLHNRWQKLRDSILVRRETQSPKILEGGMLEEKQEEPQARVPRRGRSLAAAVMLPAILVQVPSGLAIGGSLMSGLEAANMLTSSAAGNMTAAQLQNVSTSPMNSIAFNVGFSVIQVALGITTGLFMATVICTIVERRKNSLFTF